MATERKRNPEVRHFTRCEHDALAGSCQVARCKHWVCEHGSAGPCRECNKAKRARWRDLEELDEAKAALAAEAALRAKREAHRERLRSEPVVCWLDGAP